MDGWYYRSPGPYYALDSNRPCRRATVAARVIPPSPDYL